MYVALTRAEEQLYIMKPNLDLSSSNYYKFSGMQFSKLSRFLDDLSNIHDLTEKQGTPKPKRKSNFSLPMDDDLFSEPQSDLLYESSKRKKYFF